MVSSSPTVKGPRPANLSDASILICLSTLLRFTVSLLEENMLVVHAEIKSDNPIKLKPMYLLLIIKVHVMERY